MEFLVVYVMLAFFWTAMVLIAVALLAVVGAVLFRRRGSQPKSCATTSAR